MRRHKTTAQLKKDLDKVFNRFIRERDSHGDGTFTCISCSQRLPVRLMNAGHFIPKSVSLILRWNEYNVNGQCVRCNLAEQGNQLEYSRGLERKYGKGKVEELEITRHSTMKLDKGMLELLIDKYTYTVSVSRIKQQTV